MALTFAEEFELFDARKTLRQAQALMEWANRPPRSFWEVMGGGWLRNAAVARDA